MADALRFGTALKGYVAFEIISFEPLEVGISLQNPSNDKWEEHNFQDIDSLWSFVRNLYWKEGYKWLDHSEIERIQHFILNNLEQPTETPQNNPILTYFGNGGLVAFNMTNTVQDDFAEALPYMMLTAKHIEYNPKTGLTEFCLKKSEKVLDR